MIWIVFFHKLKLFQVAKQVVFHTDFTDHVNGLLLCDSLLHHGLSVDLLDVMEQRRKFEDLQLADASSRIKHQKEDFASGIRSKIKDITQASMPFASGLRSKLVDLSQATPLRELAVKHLSVQPVTIDAPGEAAHDQQPSMLGEFLSNHHPVYTNTAISAALTRSPKREPGKYWWPPVFREFPYGNHLTIEPDAAWKSWADATYSTTFSADFQRFMHHYCRNLAAGKYDASEDVEFQTLLLQFAKSEMPNDTALSISAMLSHSDWQASEGFLKSLRHDVPVLNMLLYYYSMRLIMHLPRDSLDGSVSPSRLFQLPISAITKYAKGQLPALGTSSDPSIVAIVSRINAINQQLVDAVEAVELAQVTGLDIDNERFVLELSYRQEVFLSLARNAKAVTFLPWIVQAGRHGVSPISLHLVCLNILAFHVFY
jgi:hypothetical protein